MVKFTNLFRIQFYPSDREEPTCWNLPADNAEAAISTARSCVEAIGKAFALVSIEPMSVKVALVGAVASAPQNDLPTVGPDGIPIKTMTEIAAQIDPTVEEMNL